MASHSMRLEARQRKTGGQDADQDGEEQCHKHGCHDRGKQAKVLNVCFSANNRDQAVANHRERQQQQPEGIVQAKSVEIPESRIARAVSDEQHPQDIHHLPQTQTRDDERDANEDKCRLHSLART